jgi:hypothetical protein
VTITFAIEHAVYAQRRAIDCAGSAKTRRCLDLPQKFPLRLGHAALVGNRHDIEMTFASLELSIIRNER